MPSPIAHATVGYLIYEVVRSRWPQLELRQVGPIPGLLAVTTGLSLLPDADSAVGLLAGDFARFHNNATHSLLVGLGVALVVAGLLRWLRLGPIGPWFALTLLCYELHIVMDAFTIGRGVMLVWPLSGARYLAPVMLFYGFHWSQGLLSLRHVWTLLSELAFMVTMIVAVRAMRSWPLRGQPGH